MSDKEEKLFNKPINEDELKNVSGGCCHFIGSSGSGSCSEVYFSQQCSATVEKGSRCKSDDWCHSSQVLYSKKGDEPTGPRNT